VRLCLTQEEPLPLLWNGGLLALAAMKVGCNMSTSRERLNGTNKVFPLEGKRVFVAGHRGMVGSALVRRLKSENCSILTVGRSNVDLRNQAAVFAHLQETRPDATVLAAGRVGGILANDAYPAEFLHDNLAIETNVIQGSFEAGVKRLLFLGSSCIYPKQARQPMREEALLTGPLEPTNEWYAVAKIAGLKLCEAYRRQYGVDYVSAIPCNLYGPGDNFDPQKSHVIPALIRKVQIARATGQRQLRIWGSGRPKREFLHVDDAADALVWLLQRYSEDLHINVGSGEDLAITDLAALIADIAGLDATIVNDPSKPDGTLRKLMDVSRLFATGWRPRYTLREGILHTYGWFEECERTGEVRLG